MIVRTFDGLQALTPPASRVMGSNGLALYGRRDSYGRIYATDPNVRTPADFFAFNLAHLGLHVFRRLSETDRVRLPDHQLADWLTNPNPWTTRYRLFEQLGLDLSIYSNGYWLKVRQPDRIHLVRLPPEHVTVEGGLAPTTFVLTLKGRETEFPRSEIVYFRWSTGMDPDRPQMGLSRLETLRRTIAEEQAAGEYREHFWRRGARVPGVVSRPKESKRYNDTQLKSWREQWQEAYGGVGGEDTVLLQDGETFQQTSATAKDSEFTAGGKLRREVCAASALIPQPFVGILENATFSNIKEQHKHLYQDTLGPPLEMIQEEIESQLLPECRDSDRVYVEFNIAAKLAGSFEEQADSLKTLTGKAVMTVNEARSRLNLPKDDDPESDRIAPQQGGPSDATARPGEPSPPDDSSVEDRNSDESDTEARVEPVLQAARLRQQARLARIPVDERAAAFYDRIGRWNQELTDDLTPILGEAAAARAHQANRATLDQLLALEAA